MKILLTGAAGFIGSHLADFFVSKGHEVHGVDNLITGRLENIHELLKNPSFRFEERDVSFPQNIPGKLDWILHFASPASPEKYLKYPIETLRANGEGTFHLLELAKAKNSRFLFASTSEVYGDPLIHPQQESYWGNVNPVGLRSVYDEGKRYAEALVSAFHRKNGLSVRIIRIFNTYGPRMAPDDGRVVSNFICKALKGEPLTIYGEGNQTRSFQFIEDLVNGIHKLMEIDFHQPLNLGNPAETTILDLAKLIVQMTGGRSTIVFGPLPKDDPKQRKPDISSAKTLLQWEPKVSLTEGLRSTISYFNNGQPRTTLS